MDHCQQENFYLKLVTIWNKMESFFPAIQPIKYFISLEGTFSSAREHLSNQARQIVRDCRFSMSQETMLL